MTRHVEGEPCMTVSLRHEPATASVARRLVRTDLERAGIPDPMIDDTLLVLGELMANAILHGTPNADGEIEISWCLLGHRFRLSVLDGGVAPDLKAIPFSDGATSGRGLSIIEYLCEDWSQEFDHGTRVTAELVFEPAQ